MIETGIFTEEKCELWVMVLEVKEHVDGII